MKLYMRFGKSFKTKITISISFPKREQKSKERKEMKKDEHNASRLKRKWSV